MNKFPLVTMLVLSTLSENVLAEESKDFGRNEIFINADTAIIEFISAVASKVDAKNLHGRPNITQVHAKKAIKQFCLGDIAKFPDMIATTREMSAEEFEKCRQYGAGSVIKLKIGYEALVVATNKKSNNLNLNFDERKLYQAIARDVPDDTKKRNGALTPNPFKTWNDIDKDASKQVIRILGPADKSRNERTVQLLGMEPGCRTWGWVHELKGIQKSFRLYRELCGAPRRDGQYVKAKSADTDISKKLLSEENSIGLLDYNSWQKSKDKLKSYSINEMPPTIGTISKGLYPLSRSYYVYIKSSSLSQVQGLAHLMKELLSDKALAADGYLASMGLVAMTDKERKREVKQAAEFVPMTAPNPS